MEKKHRIWQLAFWSDTWRQVSLKQRRLFIVIMLLHGLLTAFFTSSQSVTVDEPDYYRFAVNWAKGNPDRSLPIMDSKSPMMAVSLIPAMFKPLLPAALYTGDPFFLLRTGRPFMYLYQLISAFIICCWTYRIAGPQKWLLPLLFYCFDPLVFSYGMLIGSDLASTSMLLIVMYAAWRFSETDKKKYWYYLCVAAALAVLTKASMIYCYPLLLLLFGYSAWRKKSFSLKLIAINMLQFMMIQIIVINLFYYGSGTMTAFNHFNFQSHLFSTLQSHFSFAGKIPVPFPASFVQGFDMLQYHAEVGGCKPESTYRGVFLLGKLYCDQSLWYYYPVVALFKFPLFIWIIIAAAVIRFLKSSATIKTLHASFFVWMPLLYFLLLLSFTNKFQTGIRHAMILMPFLYIGLSGTINWFYYQRRNLFYTLLSLHLLSIARYLPNLLSYTNELVWNKTKAFHLLRDSSVDYGQSSAWKNDFISGHPDYKQPTNIPAAGKFAVTIEELFAEQEGEQKNIAWLRDNFEPTANYRFSILLFTISAADLKSKGLNKIAGF